MVVSKYKNHVDNIKITTPEVSAKKASVQIVSSIVNSDNSKDLSLTVTLKNPKGKKVASKTISVADKTSTYYF